MAFISSWSSVDLLRKAVRLQSWDVNKIVTTFALSSLSKPTTARVSGWCVGGAFNLMIACDLAIAAEVATFGLSEISPLRVYLRARLRSIS
jgi:enoyl-CoA hydratase/carnithine racemase